jgi:hypothetical protein
MHLVRLTLLLMHVQVLFQHHCSCNSPKLRVSFAAVQSTLALPPLHLREKIPFGDSMQDPNGFPASRR